MCYNTDGLPLVGSCSTQDRPADVMPRRVPRVAFVSTDSSPRQYLVKISLAI